MPNVPTKTKKILAREVAERHGFGHEATQVVCNDFLNSIIREIVESGRLELRGLGVFEVRLQAASRGGRDFKTGESIIIPAHRTCRFKLSSALRARLNPTTSGETVAEGEPVPLEPSQ